MLIEIVVILYRNYAANADHDILTAQLFEFVHQLRQERVMSGSQRAEADHVHVVVHRILRRFFRRLEQRAHIDIPAHVRKRRGDNLLTAVMAVLAHLRHEDTRAAAREFFKFIGHGAGLLQFRLVGEFGGIHARNGMDNRLIAARNLFDGIGDFAQGCAYSRGFHGTFEQVAVIAAVSRLGNRFKRPAHIVFIAFTPQFFEAFHLCIAHGGVVDGEDFQRVLLFETVLVQAHNRFVAGVDLCLTAGSGFLDTHLGQARRDGLGHAAQSFDFLNMRPGTADDFVGKGFHIVGTAPGVDNFADLRLILNIELRITRNARREVGRQGDSFVECIGMQGLRVAESCAHGLHRRAGDIVERVLRRKRPA